MMKQEFERIAGYEVSAEDYYKVIEPMYMATNLSKQDFVKTINRKRFAVKKESRPALGIMKMGIINRNGYAWTPNGCWRFIKYVAVEDVDIKTGKYIVRDLTEKERDELISKGRDLTMSTDYDIHYSQCLSTKRKPIEPYM